MSAALVAPAVTTLTLQRGVETGMLRKPGAQPAVLPVLTVGALGGLIVSILLVVLGVFVVAKSFEVFVGSVDDLITDNPALLLGAFVVLVLFFKRR